QGHDPVTETPRPCGRDAIAERNGTEPEVVRRRKVRSPVRVERAASEDLARREDGSIFVVLLPRREAGRPYTSLRVAPCGMTDVGVPALVLATRRGGKPAQSEGAGEDEAVRRIDRPQVALFDDGVDPHLIRIQDHRSEIGWHRITLSHPHSGRERP